MSITGELVFNDVDGGKGYLYQEVLDDFKNAKNIYITTFGLGESLDLIEKFDECKDANITLIVKIPTYSKDDEKNITLINNVFNKFIVKGYENISLYFNKNNHTKIVGTDNIMYFGSQNYTVGSMYNYEIGIIVKDKDYIEKVLEKFNIIKKTSVMWQDIYMQMYEYILEDIEILESIIDKIKTTITRVEVDEIQNYIDTRETELGKRISKRYVEFECISRTLSYDGDIVDLKKILDDSSRVATEGDTIRKILNTMLDSHKEARDSVKAWIGCGEDNKLGIYELFGIGEKQIKKALGYYEE